MKLYYATGTCSLSPSYCPARSGDCRIRSKESTSQPRKPRAGIDYFTINSKGHGGRPLQLDDGRLLTEGPAIVQYLADQKPDSGLAPRAGTFERYQLMEILNYITSEVHKGFSPLFNPKISADWRASRAGQPREEIRLVCPVF